jgi:dihydrofolate reductase
MGKLIVSENMSLDGVVQDPTGDEGFEYGGWFAQVSDEDRAAWAQLELEEALTAEALLLGRRSDAWFASRWLPRSGEWADRLNSMPKYVLSSTLDKPRWSNSTVLRGDVVDEVSRLKQAVSGDIVVYGSVQLVHSLFENDLVDELRLMVFPIALGAGERLFSDIGASRPLRLVEVRRVGSDITFLTYTIRGD